MAEANTPLVEAARPATREDLARLVDLCSQAVADLARWRGGALYNVHEGRPEPFSPALEAALRDPDHAVWVGTLDEEVFGYAVGRIEQLRDGRCLGIVEDLYVEAGARQVGLGVAILDGLLDWFKQRQCFGVDADAMPGDRLTKNFFESAGFTARRLVMHHTLPQAH